VISTITKTHFLAKNIANTSQEQVKSNFDKSAQSHSFDIAKLLWYEDFALLSKNPKLTPKWQGLSKITKINDTNARILLPDGKTNVLNVMGLKKFFSPTPNTSGGTDSPHVDLISMLSLK
jgi:hypothetical protein